MSKRILSVKVSREPDDDPDFSTLGEYTDRIEDWAIDRATGEYIEDLRDAAEKLEEAWVPPERGREFRFFKPYAGGEDEGSEDYKKYGLQDFERCEDYNRDQWSYIGIFASAEVVVEGDTVQHIRSGGLWGIESDSDDKYLGSIEEEQLDELHNQLVAIGFSSEVIHEAFDEAEVVGV